GQAPSDHRQQRGDRRRGENPRVLQNRGLLLCGGQCRRAAGSAAPFHGGRHSGPAGAKKRRPRRQPGSPARQGRSAGGPDPEAAAAYRRTQGGNRAVAPAKRGGIMRAISIHNTLTGKKEPFVPVEAGKVNMYVCGPTVYDYIHVGNARPMIFFDVVRRFFVYSGYEVRFVVNFTDVDDKLIK